MIKKSDLIKYRLQNQLLTHAPFVTSGDIVKWFGAVQAQDYLAALWAIGIRLKQARDADIEQAIADKTIVRTWPMRGTLHFTTPEDVRWMLQLLTPRVITRSAAYFRQAELDNKIFLKSAKVIESALRGGLLLTRDEIYETLERNRISARNPRGLHILGWLAQKGIICFGPRKGKQFTFALLDEWIPSYKHVKREEALAILAQRYFQSHGPATVHDFSWWSGLNLSEVNEAVNLAKDNLTQVSDGVNQYWMSAHFAGKTKVSSAAYLLPQYDEFTVAYKDRSAVLDPQYAVSTKNGIFSPTVVIRGQIAGIWKRTIKKDSVLIETEIFKPLDLSGKRAIETAAKRYSKFLGLERSA